MKLRGQIGRRINNGIPNDTEIQETWELILGEGGRGLKLTKSSTAKLMGVRHPSPDRNLLPLKAVGGRYTQRWIHIRGKNWRNVSLSNFHLTKTEFPVWNLVNDLPPYIERIRYGENTLGNVCRAYYFWFARSYDTCILHTWLFARTPMLRIHDIFHSPLYTTQTVTLVCI